MDRRSPGLIITLIIFIILTLALGVTTYFMAQGYKETSVNLKQANEKVQKAEGEIRTLNTNIDNLKAKIGDSYTTQQVDQVLQNMDKEIQMGTGDASKAPKTYQAALRMLIANLKAKNEEVASYKKQSKDYSDKANDEIKKSLAQKASFDEQRKAAQATFDKQKEADSKKLKDLETSLQDQIKKTDEIKTEAKKLNEKYREQAANAEEVSADIAKINVNLSQKLDQLSKADFEIPDGNVLYVDQSARTLRVNIGKADGVRVLTSFGIYPNNTLDLGRATPKGAIEIVRVLGEHESEARITEDETSNPIMPGDMIFTPLWKVGEEVLFALTYNLDVDGDGKGDLELLKNLIDSSGSKVVLWVDEKGETHGKMSSDISAVITANTSILDQLGNDNTKDQVTKDKILADHMNLLEDAKRNNVKEMKLAEFLRKVHYKQIAQVSRFQEQGGVGNVPMGNIAPSVSTTPVAPIYVPGKADKPPKSHGPLAPIYSENQKAPVSSGKVSDYYFRKRNP